MSFFGPSGRTRFSVCMCRMMVLRLLFIFRLRAKCLTAGTVHDDTTIKHSKTARNAWRDENHTIRPQNNRGAILSEANLLRARRAGCKSSTSIVRLLDGLRNN